MSRPARVIACDERFTSVLEEFADETSANRADEDGQSNEARHVLEAFRANAESSGNRAMHADQPIPKGQTSAETIDGRQMSEEELETTAGTEAIRQIKQYLLLALVGAFFSFTEETQILGEMLAIPFLLSIIRLVHVGVLFREGFGCMRRFGRTDSYFASGLEGAFGYPFVVLLLTTLVISALLIFVVPQFKEIFMGMRIELPLMTRFILLLSDVMTGWWWLILPIISGVPMFLAKSFTQRSVRERLTPWLQRLPVLGRIYEDSVLIAFLRQWTALLERGLDSREAFQRACIKAASRADLEIIRGFVGGDAVLMAELEEGHGAALCPLLRTYEQARLKSAASRVHFVEIGAILFMGLVIGSIVMAFFMPMGCICNCAAD